MTVSGTIFDLRELTVRTQGCRECGLCRQACGHSDCAALGRCIHRCPLGLVSGSGERITAESLAQRMLGIADMLDPDGIEALWRHW